MLPHHGPGRLSCCVGAATLALTLATTAPAYAGTSGNRAGSGGAAMSGTASSSTQSATQVSDGHNYPGDSTHMGDRILRQGMKGHDVRVLQDFLTRAGYSTPIVGTFGPTTKRNVIAFQKAHHLTANGVVTYSVNLALRAAAGATAPAVQTTGPVGKAHLNSDGTATAPANAPAAIKAVIAAGNRIAFKPYIYGGGHGSWNAAGYDCSGSVSYALHGGGLISSPEDSGSLESYGRAGAGSWITIWANAGHVYMYVAGLRFDTSSHGTNGSRWTTATRSNAGFVERHPTGY
jgi:peptidoglycan hydrolase-like protein with peptidoglycan-binding domain